ncbi:unnamed protein product [Euphydryas editha]|uniref:Uncharacterized protein n=1 Tax=Euphydryas editha TaxID=104508 RepID=A0AAU9U9H4_EUPED|nr:unnamed protein product [Euphydryas editha]
MAGLENLSERDRAVLRSIFDPTATIGDVVDDGDSFEDDEDTTDADKKSKELCLQGVQLAEANKLDDALEFLNKGIDVAPERAPGYNDRAQLFRLMKRDDGTYGLINNFIRVFKNGKTKGVDRVTKYFLL